MKNDKIDGQVQRAIRQSIAQGHMIKLPNGNYQLTRKGRAHVETIQKDTRQ